jgi:hypothetical protein
LGLFRPDASILIRRVLCGLGDACQFCPLLTPQSVFGVFTRVNLRHDSTIGDEHVTPPYGEVMAAGETALPFIDDADLCGEIRSFSEPQHARFYFAIARHSKAR